MKNKTDINSALRDRSGNIQIDGRLVGFLYDLMRDHIPPGKIEELIRNAELGEDDILYSNGWLAKYAEDIKDRLINY